MPKPCDCPPSFRRSDCRAGEACPALALPFVHSTRPAWVAGRVIAAAGLSVGLAVIALALTAPR